MNHTRPVALVTGSTRGIGRETADQLAGHGFTVVITGRNKHDARMLAAETNQGGGHALAAGLDIGDDASVADLRKLIDSKLGRLDVIVNNAAVTAVEGDQHRAAETGIDEVRSVLEVNLFGAMRVTQALLPLLRRSPHPRIVNLSTGMGQLADMKGGSAAYRISKTALNAFTRILADEESEHGVLVNAVCPGWVESDMGGPGAPRDVEEGADTVVWLATIGDDGPTGGFFRDREPISW